LEVVVDTNVWSVAFRKSVNSLTPPEQQALNALVTLLDEGRAVLFGPVRQELLSGLRSPAQYDALRLRLRAFPDPEITVDDYETAARFSTQCREAGVATSPVDMLLCAVSARLEMAILTLDRDFEGYSRVLRLPVWPVGGEPHQS
jgi:hypothetical protein